MIERGDGAGFLLEAGAPAGIGRDVGGQNLDGHVASQSRIAGAVDFAHGSGSQTGDDFIRSKVRERCLRHLGPAYRRIGFWLLAVGF